MSRTIFINLPVTDVARSTAFYEAVGATLNPTFSDETTSAMVFSDTIVAMLLAHHRFRDFTTKAIPDAKATAQVLLCLSADSREAVDDLVERAGRAGGVSDPTPIQDHGFMYGRSWEDPDGHIWEIAWMDAEAAAQAAQAAQVTQSGKAPP